LRGTLRRGNSIPSSLRLQGKAGRLSYRRPPPRASRSAIDLFGDAARWHGGRKGRRLPASLRGGRGSRRRSRFGPGCSFVVADEGHPGAIQCECGSVVINAPMFLDRRSERIVGHPESAGLNRHVVGDERALVRRENRRGAVNERVTQ
jgi:hypothetical protein